MELGLTQAQIATLLNALARSNNQIIDEVKEYEIKEISESDAHELISMKFELELANELMVKIAKLFSESCTGSEVAKHMTEIAKANLENTDDD